MRHAEIISTLQNLINTKPKNKKIAEIIGVKPTVINNRVARNSEYTYDEIKKIGDYFNVDLFSKVIIENILSDYKQTLENKVPQQKTETFMNIPYYPEVFASCGNGNLVYSEENELISIDTKIIHNYNSNNNYSIITAKGDSMSGVIEPKDKLIVRHIVNEPIIDNRIYVFSYKDDIYIKFLSKNIDEVMIRSNNPEYKTKYISDLENLRIIGEVVGLLRDMQ